MIGTPIKITNFDSGDEIVLNDHETDEQNVIALQNFPTFETDVRANNLPRQAAHGEFRLPYYYSGMSVVLQGVIVGEDEAHVWAIKRQFDDVMRLTPNNGYAKEAKGVKEDTAYAENLCSNPRAASATTGWTGDNATLSADDGLKAVAGSDADASASFEQTAEEGQVIHAALDLTNSEDDEREMQLSIQALDGSDSVLATSTLDTQTLDAGATVRFHTSLTMPAGTAKFVVIAARLTGTNADTDDEFHIDRAFFIADPAATIDPAVLYFDGDTDALSRTEYEWNGTEGLSTSKAYRVSFPAMFRNTIRLSFTDPTGKKVFLDATPIKPISYDRPLMQRYRLNFQVIVRSNFPVLLSDEDAPETFFGSLGALAYGLKLPFKVPFTLGQQYVKNAMTVTVNDPCFLTVRLYGSDQGTIVNPRITNLTNGDSMAVRRTLKGSSRYIAIDGVMQTVVDENGADVSAYGDGAFVLLEPGENILIYTADSAVPNA